MVGTFEFYKEIHWFIENSWRILKDHINIEDLISELFKIKIEKHIVNLKEKLGGGDLIRSRDNLKSMWYTSCAVNYPKDNLKERTKFLGWKFIQFYYAIYFGVSSIVRSYDSKSNESHNGVIASLRNNILENKKFPKNFFITPFNVIFIENKIKYKPKFEEFIPKNFSEEKIKMDFKFIIKDCEDYIKRFKKCYENHNQTKNRFSFFDALLYYRNQINYSSMYSMLRIYGKTYKSFFDVSIIEILKNFNIIVEIFFIKSYGFKLFEEYYLDFYNKMSDYHSVDFIKLKERYDEYKKYE